MKIKKFFIVPVVSLLLLLAYPFSSALAADEDYFLSSDFLQFDELRDIDHIRSIVDEAVQNNSIKDTLNPLDYLNCHYFYTLYMSVGNYNQYMTTTNPTYFTIYYSILRSDTISYEDNDYYIIPSIGFISFSGTISSDRSSYSLSTASFNTNVSNNSNNLIYNKNTGVVYTTTIANIPGDLQYYNHVRSEHDYILYQTSDIDFPIADGINQGGNSFDVSVTFNPALQNTVNMYTSDNGVSTLSNYFNMSVRNNGRRSIQFFMAITEPGTNVFTGYQGVYNDYGENVRFVYSSDEWIDQIDEFDVTGVNNTYVSALRRSEWHRVDPLQQVNRNFAWSQMSLQKDHFYDVVVYAMPTREGSTNVSIMHELPAFDWSSCAEVYRSSFKLPVSTKYNASDNSFGNYANSSGDTMSHSNFSAYIDDNGKVQVPGDGKYFTADDIRNRYSQGSASSSSPGSVSSDLNSVASNFHTFFEFINRIFSYFPRGYQAVITAGLTSLIVLGVLKVVLK